MATRLELHSLLCKILNCPEMGNECRAYFQPPESIRIRYPAIVYGLSNMSSLHANDGVYLSKKGYLVTVIDEDPDSVLVDAVAKIPTARFSRSYVSDNLNHTAFTLYP